MNSILPAGYVDLDVNRFVRSPMMSSAYDRSLTFELACPPGTSFFVYLVNSLGVLQSKLAELCRESTVDESMQMFLELRSVCVPAGIHSVAFVGSPSDHLPIYVRNIKLISDDCVANSRMNISEEHTTGFNQSNLLLQCFPFIIRTIIIVTLSFRVLPLASFSIIIV